MPTIGEIELKSSPNELIVQWKIKDFSSLRKPRYCSSSFSFASKSWRLEIFPNGFVADGHLSLLLWKKSPGSMKLEFSFGLKTTDEKKVLEKHRTLHFAEGEKCGRGFPEFVSKSELLRRKSELLPSDTLTVICTLKCPDGANTSNEKNSEEEVIDENKLCRKEEDIEKEKASSKIKDTSNEENSEVNTIGENKLCRDEEDIEKEEASSKIRGLEILSENLKQMFLDERMCDAILKIDDRMFNVHKFILVARSPVFASMFQHDLAEKNTNEVNIPDCTAQAFEVFLNYLYSGSVETLSTSIVCNVYYAADKFQVDDLKEKCLKFMTENITVETFCDVIALSLRHGESNVQKLATDFFCQNIKKIIKTVQWQRYMDENSTQANELLIKALDA